MPRSKNSEIDSGLCHLCEEPWDPQCPLCDGHRVKAEPSASARQNFSTTIIRRGFQGEMVPISYHGENVGTMLPLKRIKKIKAALILKETA